MLQLHKLVERLKAWEMNLTWPTRLKEMKLELTLRENGAKVGIMKVSMSSKSKTQPIFFFQLLPPTQDIHVV